MPQRSADFTLTSSPRRPQARPRPRPRRCGGHATQDLPVEMRWLQAEGSGLEGGQAALRGRGQRQGDGRIPAPIHNHGQGRCYNRCYSQCYSQYYSVRVLGRPSLHCSGISLDRSEGWQGPQGSAHQSQSARLVERLGRGRGKGRGRLPRHLHPPPAGSCCPNYCQRNLSRYMGWCMGWYMGWCAYRGGGGLWNLDS